MICYVHITHIFTHLLAETDRIICDLQALPASEIVC